MKNTRVLVCACLAVVLMGCSYGPLFGTHPTVSAAHTPSLTPTWTPPPTPTPSPTPTPQVRIESGERAFFNGNYDQALVQYQAAFDTTPDPNLRAAALWGLGRVQQALENYGRALEILRQLAADYPASPEAARAYFLMGQIFSALERYPEAAEAYRSYLNLRPGVIDAYTQERLGDALAASGSYSGAVIAYQAALGAPRLGDGLLLQVKIAQALATLGDTATALDMYAAIQNAASNDYLKAQMDFLSGQIHLSLGQTDPAYQHFLHAVENYPKAYDSYSVLVALVNASVPVDDFQRGLVDYYAGQYGYALDAFNRYIAGNPSQDGTANYFICLTYLELGQYEQAVAAFTAFLGAYPENRYWPSAWQEKSYTQWANLGQYMSAAQTLQDYINRTPDPTVIPQALLDLGRIYERDNQLEQAASTWESLADGYPSDELVPQSLFWAGIARYRMGQYDQALVDFQRGSILSTLPEDQARAYFWSGKVEQHLGNFTAAQSSWQLAAALDRSDYYSLRARDMLLGNPPFDQQPGLPQPLDLPVEKAEAEAWIRVTFSLPADTDLSTPGALLAEARLLRGTELWTLGEWDAARSEFEDLRFTVSSSAADSYRLANYLLDLGLYRPAIFAMRQVLTLAGMTTQPQTLAAPSYFNHVRYGFYYPEIVLSAAQQYGFNPLFLYAVLRQESLFEFFIRSNAGARGLMQVIPDTGQYLADLMDWPPGYTSADLYRPLVNISMGSNYLMINRNRFDGDLYSALAAYNAGPSSVEVWLGLSGADPDLFVEVVRYEETRNYIRSIYEAFWMYRMLYESIP